MQNICTQIKKRFFKIMKILILTGSFFPAQEGGPTNAVYWLASGLASCGYKVHVIANTKGLPEGIKINEWTNLNGFKVIYCSLGKGHNVVKKELLESECLIRSGVCHVQTHLSNLSYLKSGKKLILSPRGELFYPAIYHKGRWFGTLKLLFLKFMGLLYGKRIIYHATSLEEKKQIHKIFGRSCRVFIAPSYMILPAYIEEERKEQYKDFVYVGRIAKIKALDKLIKALSISTLFRSSSCNLNIIGDAKGDYYNRLITLIEELDLKTKVRFLGVITGKEKNRLIANSRYLLLVSESENFGNVVIEAIAQGTPVIASKGTPWSELAKHNAGYWCSNTPENLAMVIDSALSIKKEDYFRQRDNAYKFSKKFDIYSNMEIWKSNIEH